MKTKTYQSIVQPVRDICHEVLRLLIDGYPEGLYAMNCEGRLPFFCAMENDSITMDCLNLLYERYSLDLTLRDGRGNTPLGLACDRGTQTNVEWIIANCPENAQIIADSYGNLPVHNAASAYGSRFNVELLVEAFPGSLLEKNHAGHLPLHPSLACQHRSLHLVKFLLKACPKAASREDRLGQLPLHLICSGGAYDIELVDLLIKHHPQALAVYDNYGHLPFHVAVLRRGRFDVPLIRHWITKLQCSSLPWTKKGIPPLILLACEHKHAELDFIYLLVHQSMELFSGDVRIGRNSRALALSDQRRKKSKRGN
jgi:hypothetical protein